MFGRFNGCFSIDLVPLVFLVKYLCQGPKQQDSENQQNQPDGQGGKKLQAFESRSKQRIVHNERWRSADQRHHASDTTGVSHRHQQSARAGIGFYSHARHNRHKQRHRSGVAQKRTDKSGYKHNQQEQFITAVSRKL